MQGTRAVHAQKLLSHLYGIGAHLAAAPLPGAAHLLVCVWSVTRAFPRMRGSPILSPSWFPVLPRLVICPSPRGGGCICSGLDITPSHGAQDAQAQDKQQKTCHHVQAPSMTSMGMEAGRDAMQVPSLWGLPVYDSIELLSSCLAIPYQDLLHALHGIRQDRVPLLPE